MIACAMCLFRSENRGHGVKGERHCIAPTHLLDPPGEQSADDLVSQPVALRRQGSFGLRSLRREVALAAATRSPLFARAASSAAIC